MPNWTTNTIRAEGDEDDIRAFLDAVKWQDELFDFARLIPMPPLLRHTASGSQIFDGERHENWFVENPDAEYWEQRIERPFTNEEKTALAQIGYMNWYDWSVAHWGTKWKACRAEIADECLNGSYVVITFATAWAPPLPVFYVMVEKFPALSFTFSWRNEGEREVHSIRYTTTDEEDAAA